MLSPNALLCPLAEAMCKKQQTGMLQWGLSISPVRAGLHVLSDDAL